MRRTSLEVRHLVERSQKDCYRGRKTPSDFIRGFRPYFILLLLVSMGSGSKAFASLPDAKEPIISVKTELDRLAQELGEPISANASLGRHLILVDRHGKSAATMLQAVACCLRAKIVNQNGKISIMRSEKDLDRIRSAQMHERAVHLHDGLAELVAWRQSTLRGSSMVHEISELIRQRAKDAKEIFSGRPLPLSRYGGTKFLPAHLLLEGIVSRIGEETVAKDSWLGSIVFEKQPVQGAFPLPDCEDLLADYNSSIAALRASKPSDEIQGDIKKYSVFMGGYESWLSGTASAAKIRLKSQVVDDVLVLSLELFDQNGNLVDSASFDGIDTQNLVPRSPERLLAGHQGSGVVKLTEEQAAAFSKKEYPPSMLPNWFLHPETDEPLNEFVGPALMEIAEDFPDKCVAMDVSDSLWDCAGICIKDGGLDVEAFRTLMAKLYHYDHTESAEIAAWMPKYFDFDESRNANRRALARYAQSLQNSGHVDNRQKSKAFHEASDRPGPLADRFTSIRLQGDEQASDSTLKSIWWLAGGISDQDWDRLLSGQKITVSELGITKALENVFEEDRLTSQADFQLPELYRHPSELFQSLGFGDAVVSLWTKPDLKVSYWPADAAKEGPRRWAPIQFIAAFAPLRYEGTSEPALVTSRESFDEKLGRFHYRLAESHLLKLRLDFPDHCFADVSFPESIEHPSKVLGFADFPDSVRDNLWENACKDALDHFRRIQKAINDSREKGDGGHL